MAAPRYNMASMTGVIVRPLDHQRVARRAGLSVYRAPPFCFRGAAMAARTAAMAVRGRASSRVGRPAGRE